MSEKPEPKPVFSCAIVRCEDGSTAMQANVPDVDTLLDMILEALVMVKKQKPAVR